MKKQVIKQLSDRDHVLCRQSVYIGSINHSEQKDFILDETNKFVHKEINYVSGFLKIINEIIDNSLDEAIRTNYKYANEISVKATDTYVEIEDNGRGIPTGKNEDGIPLPRICWGSAKAGSNFEDDENRVTVGMNGVGSFCTNVFSKKFTGETCDGDNLYKVIFKNNAESFKEEYKKPTSNTYTRIKFFPDLKRFGLESIDETHKLLIQQRLIHLSANFPEIRFKFNKRVVKSKNSKTYLSHYGDNFIMAEDENWLFGIFPSDSDEFEHNQFVNGVHCKKGGDGIDFITRQIVNGVRDKLVKKYKAIKPADIRNKLKVIAVFRNFKDPQFESQTKEQLTSGETVVNKYMGDWDKAGIIKKVLKNNDIIEPIIDIFKMKQELADKKKLKALGKTVKKIKNEKYLAPIGGHNMIMLCEGDSAASNLMSILGRKGNAYLALKGKPLNVLNASPQKISANKELGGLLEILHNTDFNKIVLASDQDLDGMHIRMLLISFIYKFFPEKLKDKTLYCLDTPVAFIEKNDKLIKWFYDIDELNEYSIKSGEKVSYAKGLGAWETPMLKEIIKTDGLDNMLKSYDFNNKDLLLDWMVAKNVDKRKEYLQNNNFNIAQL